MPIYEFKCNKCCNVFEKLVFPSDEESHECPSCGADDAIRQMSSFSSCSNSQSGGDNSLSSASCSPSGGFS